MTNRGSWVMENAVVLELRLRRGNERNDFFGRCIYRLHVALAAAQSDQTMQRELYMQML